VLRRGELFREEKNEGLIDRRGGEKGLVGRGRKKGNDCHLGGRGAPYMNLKGRVHRGKHFGEGRETRKAKNVPEGEGVLQTVPMMENRLLIAMLGKGRRRRENGPQQR